VSGMLRVYPFLSKKNGDSESAGRFNERGLLREYVQLSADSLLKRTEVNS